VLIRHLNKTAGERSLYRGAGSIGLLAACRCAWLFAAEPPPPGQAPPAPAPGPAVRRCVLAQLKNNLVAPQPSLASELRTGEGSLPQLTWLGACAWTADRLLARPSRKALPPRRRAGVFLKHFLADGPRTTAAIWAAGMEEGLYERTLRRAKKDLTITAQEVTVDGKRRCYWLQGPGAPAPEDEVDAWLADLAKQYPPRNPLDEEGGERG
jgi:hypothetical protein